MPKLKNAIFTACDAKYGDFLVKHWLKSLKDNVDLNNIEIIVLDYGLNETQNLTLKKEKVTVLKCIKDGHVTSLRFRDMAKFLKNHIYNQILTIDGGDIIFQTDIKSAFKTDNTCLRAVVEDVNFPFEGFYTKKFFAKEDGENIRLFLKDKRLVNAGVLIGPHKEFKQLCEECNSLIKDKSEYGPDQVAVNYLLYKYNFKKLDNKYNFVITTAKRKFYINGGIFYFREGEKIPIIHNANNFSYLRPVKNFGYGPNCNQLKITTYILVRMMFSLLGFFKTLLNRVF